SYKDRQDTDKKIKDVRKQYHSNKNYTYCGLMTAFGLNPNISTNSFAVILIFLIKLLYIKHLRTHKE
ncbi:hypothetical protein, partial [Prevotella sp.]